MTQIPCRQQNTPGPSGDALETLSKGTAVLSAVPSFTSVLPTAMRLSAEVRHCCQTDLIEFDSCFVARGEQIELRHRSVLRRNGRTWNNRRRRPVTKPENNCCCLYRMVHRKGGNSWWAVCQAGNLTKNTVDGVKVRFKRSVENCGAHLNSDAFMYLIYQNRKLLTINIVKSITSDN